MSAPIFLGFDARAPDAIKVCEESLTKHASSPLDLRRLDLADLRERGLYTRPHEMREGRLWDVISDQPMSTEFAISRFLVPALCDYQGWALYCDCDFMFRADVAELFAMASDRYALQVVKHHYLARHGPKMNGQSNMLYPRKNWSSLMLFNCGHPSNKRLTVEVVNTWNRNSLHAFHWLHDWQIGALPFEWNWLDLKPKAVHFTAGTPDLAGYESTAYGEEYLSYL